MNIQYRKTVVDEAASMVSVYNRAFYDDYVKYGVCPGYGHSIDEMKESIVKNMKYSILDGDELIGAISVAKKDGEYYLGCLCVVPEYQGKGIGTEAMHFLEEELKDWEVMTLETPADKTENVKFYTECCSSTYIMLQSSNYLKLHLYNIVKLVNGNNAA